MGTNYYMRPPTPDSGGEADYYVPESSYIHIGKRSAGWRFLFHGYRPAPDWDGDDYGMDTTEKVFRRIDALLAIGWVIVNERGAECSRGYLLEQIRATKDEPNRHSVESGKERSSVHRDSWSDGDYEFSTGAFC